MSKKAKMEDRGLTAEDPARSALARGGLTTLGPCFLCEYPVTHCFMGRASDMQPYCALCTERLMARTGMVREPEFFVI